MAAGITIIGLGPGSKKSLTLEAWELIIQASEIYLRTREHPVVAEFPETLSCPTFDELYGQAENFEQVYREIVDRILELGRRPQGVIYGVPGHPLVAETTCEEIIHRAAGEGLNVRIITGLSFLEPVFTALRVDPFPQTALVDAFELARAHHPTFSPDNPAIIAQLFSRELASDVKLTLMAEYPDDHPVVLVHGAGTDREAIENVPLFGLDRSKAFGSLTCLFLPPLAPGSSFESFQETIAHLRAPEGCPWDQAQTHLSLRPYLLEEAYEVIEALDREDSQALQEELGDLLIQIVLHTQISSEEGDFTMADVLQDVNQKLIYRHPHVFGDLDVADVREVKANWDRLKAEEKKVSKGTPSSVLDGVPTGLPALAQADAYQKRAARTGFDWPEVTGVEAKVLEEFREVQTAPDSRQRLSEVGDLLFAVVNLARWYDVDPEAALRQTNRKFRARFGVLEQEVLRSGRKLEDLSLEEMDRIWEAAKHPPDDHERGSNSATK